MNAFSLAIHIQLHSVAAAAGDVVGRFFHLYIVWIWLAFRLLIHWKSDHLCAHTKCHTRYKYIKKCFVRFRRFNPSASNYISNEAFASIAMFYDCFGYRSYVFYVAFTFDIASCVLLCIHQHNMNTSMAAVVGNNWEICKMKELIIKICHASSTGWTAAGACDERNNNNNSNSNTANVDGNGNQHISIDWIHRTVFGDMAFSSQ